MRGIDQVPARRAPAAPLSRAVTALSVIVAGQIVALQVVLRGWQSWQQTRVFAGIGVSAILLLCAVIIFVRTRPRAETTTSHPANPERP